MRILIKSVFVQDSRSSAFGKQVDLLADNGQWVQIAPSIQASADLVIDGSNLNWAPSLVDLRVHHTLPGGEHREDWDSLTQAALKGGVLDMLLLPTGSPVPQQAEAIHFISQKSGTVSFHPMAPLSLDNKGENFTDLLDLHRAGANWFGHGDGSLQAVDLMSKSLQYLQTLPVTIVSRPDTEALSLYGQIHEGLQSTLLGLKGIPVLTESMSIKRDLDLLRYVRANGFGLAHADFRLHFSCISSGESMDLLQAAKKEGLPVTCDVAVHQLIFTEEAISEFDTNKKVFPPFRTTTDLDALWKGLKSGVIDVVVSDHHPVEFESKALEFDHAEFGSIGLETLLIAFTTVAQKRGLPNALDYLTHKPAALLGVNLPVLELGASVQGIVYDGGVSHMYQLGDIVSRSKNSCFLGETFNSQVAFVLKGEHVLYQR
ncbi:dihydroorotase family protein [Aquirufa sp.]|jgi:dihydroorotase|uniref:dihydroorotase family protein n=1 Tax=Aquirufa sp. TaxID=2676249 RepID=UPI0037BE3428